MSLPDASVLVSDPPYGIANKFGVNNGRGLRTLQFGWDQDGRINETVTNVFISVFPHVSSFHVFCGPEQFGLIAEAARENGITPKPWAWVKDCPPPAGKGNWWPSGFELAMYGYRSGAWFGDTDPKRSNVYRSDTYRHGIRANEKVDHPTQKWLPMICDIVGAIVPPDGTAVDPFMGSGTTAAAARCYNRQFIGIEKERRYFDIVVERVTGLTGDGPLFDTSQPTQMPLVATPRS